MDITFTKKNIIETDLKNKFHLCAKKNEHLSSFEVAGINFGKELFFLQTLV